MSDFSNPQRPRAATCEDEWDEDLDERSADDRTYADVAAKKSKPELNAKASYERRRRPATNPGKKVSIDSPPQGRKERKATELKVATSFSERESRPYHYSTPRTEERQSAARPVLQRSDSSTSQPAPFYVHREGECWICDKYGKHIDPPTTAPAAESPSWSRHQPSIEELRSSHAENALLKARRSSSHRARPVSMYVGGPAQAAYQARTLPSPFATESPAAYPWQHTPVTPATYAAYSDPHMSQSMTPIEPQRDYFRTLPPTQGRPSEPSRRSSTYEQFDRPSEPSRRSSTYEQYGRPSEPSRRSSTYEQYDRPADSSRRSSTYEQYGRPSELTRRSSTYEQNDRPVVKQSRSKDSEARPALHSQKSSRDKDYDRQVMPPPAPQPKQAQVVLAHRPSVKKSASSSSVPSDRRRPQTYDTDRPEIQRLESIRERHAENSAGLHSSSRRPSSASTNDRPLARKMTSYDQSRHSIEVASSRVHPSTIERHEAEAEAYQRKHGVSDLHSSLTAEALKSVPKGRPSTSQSETNSSQKSRNSSSKGSSGAKTGKSNSDMMIRVNGIALGIPGDNAQRITIVSKGVNIRVGAPNGRETEYAGSGASVRSKGSKTSSGREKERERDRNDELISLRERQVEQLEHIARRRQSMSRYGALVNDGQPLVYGA